MIESLKHYFADFGVTATWTPSGGGAQQSAKVLIESPSMDVVFDEFTAKGRDIKITYDAADFIGLTQNEVLNIQGKDYRVVDLGVIDDGKISQAKLGTFT